MCTGLNGQEHLTVKHFTPRTGALTHCDKRGIDPLQNSPLFSVNGFSFPNTMSFISAKIAAVKKVSWCIICSKEIIMPSSISVYF